MKQRNKIVWIGCVCDGKVTMSVYEHNIAFNESMVKEQFDRKTQQTKQRKDLL